MRWILSRLLLVVGSAIVAAGQTATVPVTFAWTPDVTHQATATWEAEVDGVIRPCATTVVTPSELRCTASGVTLGTHTFRIRGTVIGPDGPLVGSWSAALTDDILPPGPFSVILVDAPTTGPGTPPNSMATRFYLPSTGTPSIAPAYGGSWETGGAARRTMVRTRISSAFAEADRGTGSTGSPEYSLLRQYISDSPLAAQTLSGTIKGVVRARETHPAANAEVAIRVAVCASDGTNVRELLAIASEGDAAGNNTGVAPEFDSAALTNRRFEQGTDDFDLDLTSTAINAGDYLIVEIGYGDISTSTSRYGVIEFGDAAASDLAEDESSTDQFNPWVEFSQTISFQGGATRVALNTRAWPLGTAIGMGWRMPH